MKKEIIFLSAVFFLATFLRFYKLSSIPLGLYVDEAAIGYNSYSISQTGKDEYGQAFPVYFRSFGDYKMPLYIYLSTIPIKLFGLNVFSVRFLSAFCGSLTILVVYFLTKNLFPAEKKVALLSVLIFAILPWTVFLSRMALEMQLGLFLLLLALLFHQKALQKGWLRWWLLAGIFYVLASYAYHTEKFISPLIFIIWSLINFWQDGKKGNFQRWRNFLIAAIVLIVLLGPQLKLSFSYAANARINNLTYFKNTQNLPYGSGLWAIMRKWGAMYTAYFSPRNLFYDPDPDPQRSLPQLSVFYSWMVVFFLTGIFFFLKKNDDKIGKRLIWLLLLIAPLPASLTNDPFSSFRAFPLVFPLVIIISLGIARVTEKLNKFVFLLIGGIVLCLSLGLLYRSLFVLLPQERFDYWSYGFSQITEKIKANQAPKILLNDPKGTSYIELLFFLGYSPKDYQAETLRNKPRDYYRDGEWINTFSWDNIQVRSIVWKDDIYKYQLIISPPLGISAGQAEEQYMTKTFAIIGPNGAVAFNGYLTNPLLKNSGDKIKLKKLMNR